MGTRTNNLNNVRLTLPAKSILNAKIEKRHFKDYRDAEEYIKNRLKIKSVNYTILAPEQFNLLNDYLIDEYNFKPFRLYGISSFGRDIDPEDCEYTNMMVEDFDISRPRLLINQKALRNFFTNPDGKTLREAYDNTRRKVRSAQRNFYKIQEGPDPMPEDSEEYKAHFNTIDELQEKADDYKKMLNEGFECFLTNSMADSPEESFGMIIAHEIAHVRQSNMKKQNMPRRHRNAARCLYKLPNRSAYPNSYLRYEETKDSFYDEKAAELYSLYRFKPEILTRSEHKFIKTFFEL